MSALSQAKDAQEQRERDYAKLAALLLSSESDTMSNFEWREKAASVVEVFAESFVNPADLGVTRQAIGDDALNVLATNAVVAYFSSLPRMAATSVPNAKQIRHKAMQEMGDAMLSLRAALIEIRTEAAGVEKAELERWAAEKRLQRTRRRAS